MSTCLPDSGRLSVLVHIARHGSLSAAGRVLGVTTSAVSQQLSALEAECGVALVERGPRGVSLTGDGLVLLEHAERVLHQLDEARATMDQLHGRLAGRVRVASIASAAASIVLPAVRLLATSAPEVAMTVTTAEPLVLSLIHI